MADRVQELIEKLSSSDRDVVKSTVIEDLGNQLDPRAINPLIEALNDKETLVRWNAIKALGRFGERSIAPLMRALDSNDRFTRRNVVQALGEVGGDDAVDRLIRMLMFDESDQMVQIEVIRALDRIGDPRAVDPIITVLKLQDWEMRYRAVHALEHLGDPRAIEPLLDVMNDPDKDIQWAAYMAIEGIKARAADGSAPEKPAPRKKSAEVQRADQLKLTAELKSDRAVIMVDGDLLYANADNFMSYVDGVLSVSRNDLEIALGSCGFVDSFALSRLNSLRKKLKTRNRNLVLSALRTNVLAMFTATKLDQVFDIR